MVESLRRRAGRFGLDIVMVDLWEGQGAAEEAARYCEMWGIEATVLLDETAEYARRVGVRGVPTNVFVDEHGIVCGLGATTSEDLLREAVRLEPALSQELDDPLASERIPNGFASNAG